MFGKLSFELLEDGRKVRLTNHLDVICEKIFRIPEGFISDFASVPRFFWRILPPWGRYAPAAVAHDYLYANGLICSRKEADLIFLKLMENLGVSWWKRKTMYQAVRMFGGNAWNDCRGGKNI
jgi:hypothetical protein